MQTDEKEKAVDAILAEAKLRESRREKKPEPVVKVQSKEDRETLSDIHYENLYGVEDLL